MKLFPYAQCVCSMLLYIFGTISIHAQAQSTVIVEGIAVEKYDLYELVPVSGQVYSNQIANLSPKVGGWVTEVLVDAGDKVRIGQTLVKLDPTLIDIALAEASALQKNAMVTRDLRETQYREVLLLAKKGNISESEVRRQKSEFDIAEANLGAATARLQQVKAHQGFHKITAPFDATVSKKLVAVSEWVEPGTALLELADNKNLKIDFQVSERFYTRISEDVKLNIQLDSHPGEKYQAQVRTKVPLSQSESRTFLVRTEITDSAVQLIPGMTVSGELRLPRPGVLAVPGNALIRYPDGRVTVWIASSPDGDNKMTVEEKLVQPGIKTENRIEITHGVHEGDIVITVSNGSLQPGQRVQLKAITSG